MAPTPTTIDTRVHKSKSNHEDTKVLYPLFIPDAATLTAPEFDSLIKPLSQYTLKQLKVIRDITGDQARKVGVTSDKKLAARLDGWMRGYALLNNIIWVRSRWLVFNSGDSSTRQQARIDSVTAARNLRGSLYALPEEIKQATRIIDEFVLQKNLIQVLRALTKPVKPALK